MKCSMSAAGDNLCMCVCVCECVCACARGVCPGQYKGDI